MHFDIKRFTIDGSITSDKFIESKSRLEKELESSMRDSGYVPVIELLPVFSRDYDQETESFNFTMSIYGTYIGEEAWEVGAISMNGQRHQRYTPPIR